MGKMNSVRSYFDQTDNYLNLSYVINVRTEIVGKLCGAVNDACILDVGCGNGAISRQFFTKGKNHLTLLDISANMLAIAKQGFASENSADGSVTFVLGDVSHLDVTLAFDYILALGVLGHVNTPKLFIKKLACLLKPGGRLLLQLTDYGTPLGALLWHYQTKREFILKRRKYKLNKLSLTQIQLQASHCGLITEGLARHFLILPGIDKFIPDRILFKYESAVWRSKMLSRWGADCVVMFKKDSPLQVS